MFQPPPDQPGGDSHQSGVQPPGMAIFFPPPVPCQRCQPDRESHRQHDAVASEYDWADPSEFGEHTSIISNAACESQWQKAVKFCDQSLTKNVEKWLKMAKKQGKKGQNMPPLGAFF